MQKHDKSDKSDIKKKELLLSLEKTMGIIGDACTQVGIHRSTYYEWLKADEEFKKSCLDIAERKKDFIENALMKKVNDGDTSCIIFCAKTLLRDRGYTERIELTGADNAPLLQPLIQVTLAGLPKE